MDSQIESEAGPTSLPDHYELGDVSGILENINIHKRKNTCKLYPVDGNKGITLHFEKRHLAKLMVSSLGSMSLNMENSILNKVEVHAVEVHPKDDDLPLLLDLCGAAPDLTGGLSTRINILKKTFS